MGFVEQAPREFNRLNIEKINSDQVGVYGIYKSGQWVYVGKGDIRQRLLDHLNGDNPLILQHNPTHWVDELTAGDPSNREKQLILELSPVCNKRVG
jgi:hypothetical protein